MSENVPATPDPLAMLRAREPAHLGAALADDPDLIRVAHAWAYVDVRLTLPDEPPPLGKVRDLWAWFWGGCDFDLSELAELAGLSENDTRIGFVRLRGLCMIYPDGTLTGVLTSMLVAASNRGVVEVR